VVKPVGVYRVSPADSRLNRANVCSVARIEKNGCFSSFEGGDNFFQLLMQFKIAGNETGCTGSSAIAADCIDSCFFFFFFICKSEIII